jgi:hypothetical protein
MDEPQLSAACQVAVVVLVQITRHTLFRTETFLTTHSEREKEWHSMVTTVLWITARLADPDQSSTDEGSTGTGDG